jgi:hypothetical protein
MFQYVREDRKISAYNMYEIIYIDNSTMSLYF